MKKLLLTVALVAATAAFAEKKDAYDIRPDAAKAGEAPTSVEWQDGNGAALAAATADEVLAAFTADEDGAAALLAKVRPAYATDPMVASQIAAVSQWVMGSDCWFAFWKPSREDGRRVWTRALLERVRTADDAYVRQFCLDQLRWCGYPAQAKTVREIVVSESRKEVRDFAELVATELEGRSK